MAGERIGGMAAVAGPVEVLEPRRLQLLEAGVGEVGELLVVAGEDHRVAGEVGRVAVVVEVVEVGEQEDRVARVDLGPRRLPGLAVALLEGPHPQRRAGQLVEVLLEPRGAAVEPAARGGVLEGHVVEAGAGAEPERHLLADLAPRGSRAGCAARSSRSGCRGGGCSRGPRAPNPIILARRVERRPQDPARDAHPLAHPEARGGDAHPRQGRQQQRDLVDDRRRARDRRPVEPRSVADLRRARARSRSGSTT